jgi:uncharacterized protein (TIGR00251 family)
MLPLFAREDGDTLLLALKVVPNAKKAGVAGILGERLKVRVSQPPEDGKANRAVCALLQTWLSATRVQIEAGYSQAEKTARVEGISVQDFNKRVTLLLQPNFKSGG